MQQVSESFIMEAYNQACNNWKNKIKKEFPQLFQGAFKIGDRFVHTTSKNVYILSKLFGGAFVLVNVGTGTTFNKAIQIDSNRYSTKDTLNITEFNSVVMGRGAEFTKLIKTEIEGYWKKENQVL